VLRRKAAEEELERNKDELLGQGAILDQRILESLNSGRFISSNEVHALVFRFLNERFPATRIIREGDEPCAVLEFDTTCLDHVRRTIERENLHSRVSLALSSALSGSRRLRVTFDSDMARQSPELDFITIAHPLAVAARSYWKGQEPNGLPCGRLIILGSPGETGQGAFYLYEVEVKAVNGDVTLEPVIILDDGRVASDSAQRLLSALQVAQDATRVPEPDSDAILRLLPAADSIIARKRADLEEQARRRNKAALVSREAALRNSFGAKINRATHLRDTVPDERIRRMYSSQALRLAATMDAKIAELDNLREVGVSSRLVLGGRVEIVSAGEAA
jgi:hypothetical protein